MRWWAAGSIGGEGGSEDGPRTTGPRTTDRGPRTTDYGHSRNADMLKAETLKSELRTTDY